MNLKALLLYSLIAFSMQLFSQGYTIEIIKTDNKILQKTDSLMFVNFNMMGAEQNDLVILKEKALDFEGVQSFDCEVVDNEKSLVIASFVNDFNEIKFQKLLITLNVQIVIVDDVEIETKSVSQAFRNNPEYRKDLKLINQRIKDIQTKIDWVKGNDDEKKLAEENGWFEKAYLSLEEAKNERKELMENTSK